MRSTPWKVLLGLSLCLTVAGCLLIGWSIANEVGPRSTVIGVFVVSIGALLARMTYRAIRYAKVPEPSTTLPIIVVSACALLWIAIVVGVL